MLDDSFRLGMSVPFFFFNFNDNFFSCGLKGMKWLYTDCILARARDKPHRACGSNDADDDD